MTEPAVEDPYNAFVDLDVHLIGAAEGPLEGCTFAAKDLFDVQGHTTGAGNPDWLATHAPATGTASAVNRLVDAGATLVGKTVTDELAYSLLGVNIHYGTPVNPVTPDSVPGGSSSGSAAAVAGHVVDFAIGTDTAGSVRVPAALCGLYGCRPTHGAISLDHTFALAPSFDTVGWFARDSLMLWRVGSVLLPPAPAGAPHISRLIVADDVFACADEPVVDALFPSMQRLAMRLQAEHVPVLAGAGIDAWADAFRVLQGAEVWAEHHEWLESTNPTLALDVRNRIERLRSITEDDVTRARAVRDQVTSQLVDLLGRDAALALPTVPEIAPLLDSNDEQFADFRRRTFELTCIASLAGLPQVTVPAAHLAEYPVGISLIGGPGTDHQVIALAATIARPAD